MNEEEQQQLRRSLKARHLNMIAIGGAIGTGLFVAGGETVNTAGPGGALVAYSLIGVMVYFLTCQQHRKWRRTCRSAAL